MAVASWLFKYRTSYGRAKNFEVPSFILYSNYVGKFVGSFSMEYEIIFNLTPRRFLKLLLRSTLQ